MNLLRITSGIINIQQYTEGVNDFVKDNKNEGCLSKMAYWECSKLGSTILLGTIQPAGPSEERKKDHLKCPGSLQALKVSYDLLAG